MTEDQIKAEVRARDGSRCTVCGMSNETHRAKYHGKSLHVHRKEPGSDYTVDGCVTLCARCHGTQPRTPPWTLMQYWSRLYLPPGLARRVCEWIDGKTDED